MTPKTYQDEIVDPIIQYWSNSKIAEYIVNSYLIGNDKIKEDRFRNEVHSLTEELRAIYDC